MSWQRYHDAKWAIKTYRHYRDYTSMGRLEAAQRAIHLSNVLEPRSVIYHHYRYYRRYGMGRRQALDSAIRDWWKGLPHD